MFENVAIRNIYHNFIMLLRLFMYYELFVVNVLTFCRAENKGASNVNDAPLLAFDAPNQNFTRHDDASLFAIIAKIISTCSYKI